MGRGDEQYKLFIGGLASNTDTQSLREHFSEYGELTDCIVMKDANGNGRGFGFVTYESEEGFNHIVDNGGRVIVDGKEVEAKPATGKPTPNAPMQNGTGKTRDVSGKIFIGGTGNLTTDQLSAHFSQYGEITDAIAMVDPRGTPRGFGFVTFANEYDAETAVNGDNEVEGVRVDCKHADGTTREGGFNKPSGRPHYEPSYQQKGNGKGKGYAPPQYSGKSKGKGGNGPANDNYKIFVGGLPNSVSTERLHDMFQMYGPIADCIAFETRGFGYVTFEDNEGKQRALQQKSVHIDGKWVEIKDRESKGGPPAGKGNYTHHNNAPYARPSPPSYQHRAPQKGGHHDGGKNGGHGGKGGKKGGEQGKIFVGGLNHSTNDSSFRRYFEQFGELTDCIVMKTPTGSSRGFGFVTFADPSISRSIVGKTNVIDDQQVDAKMAEREPTGGKY